MMFTHQKQLYTKLIEGRKQFANRPNSNLNFQCDMELYRTLPRFYCKIFDFITKFSFPHFAAQLSSCLMPAKL